LAKNKRPANGEAQKGTSTRHDPSGVPLGFAISPRNLNIHPKESRSDSEGRMYKTHRPSFGELYIVLG